MRILSVSTKRGVVRIALLNIVSCLLSAALLIAAVPLPGDQPAFCGVFVLMVAILTTQVMVSLVADDTSVSVAIVRPGSVAGLMRTAGLLLPLIGIGWSCRDAAVATAITEQIAMQPALLALLSAGVSYALWAMSSAYVGPEPLSGAVAHRAVARR